MQHVSLTLHQQDQSYSTGCERNVIKLAGVAVWAAGSL